MNLEHSIYYAPNTLYRLQSEIGSIYRMQVTVTMIL